MEERLRDQRLRGAQNDILCGARPLMKQTILNYFLANENIHYYVDENLWPNPQDRVDKNIEEQ